MDQFWAIVNTTTENWTLLVDFDGARIVRDDGTLVVFRDARDAGEPARPWAKLRKPLIGAVNGVTVTGGFELALLCDFLVASEKASFGDTHARVGILPGWGLSVLLPQAIGVRRAVEMSLTGNFMHATRRLLSDL